MFVVRREASAGLLFLQWRFLVALSIMLLYVYCCSNHQCSGSLYEFVTPRLMLWLCLRFVIQEMPKTPCVSARDGVCVAASPSVQRAGSIADESRCRRYPLLFFRESTWLGAAVESRARACVRVCVCFALLWSVPRLLCCLDTRYSIRDTACTSETRGAYPLPQV